MDSKRRISQFLCSGHSSSLADRNEDTRPANTFSTPLVAPTVAYTDTHSLRSTPTNSAIIPTSMSHHVTPPTEANSLSNQLYN